MAFLWEGNDVADEGKITYRQLHADVCKFANVLKAKGVAKGDRVAMYMPMTFELVVSMLACARIGAVHSIVFGGYSSDSLATRLVDGGVKLLVTADGVWRGNKLIHLLEVSQHAMELAEKDGHAVSNCVVVAHLDRLSHAESRPADYDKVVQAGWRDTGRDSWWHEDMKGAAAECEVEWMGAEDPLFILYTSGSTGTPKGVLHTTAGYMTYAATTFKYDFDWQEGDVYWCTADIGKNELLKANSRRFSETVLLSSFRLDHWPHVRDVRPHAERRHLRHLRGNPVLPVEREVLGDHRQVPRLQVLHRAHRHPRTNEVRRGIRGQA